MTMWSPNKPQWDDEDDNFQYKYTIGTDGEVESIEEIPIEKKGYEVLEDKIIKCADCNRKLVEIIKVQEDESIIKRVCVQCVCGGSSFIYEIKGKTYIQPFNNRTIKDIDTEIQEGIMHINIEII